MIRVGNGYDVHAFEPGGSLILGGVRVPHELGLKGHSDADVLLHAVIDALLGASALGDIGKHYPPTEALYKDISSLLLLSSTVELLTKEGYAVSNIDSTIICERPRLAEFIPDMVQNISDTLLIETGRVNVKATTTEGLGFTGRSQGIAAYAVVLIEGGPS